MPRRAVPPSSRLARLAPIVTLVALQACDWVDATGRQGSDPPASVATALGGDDTLALIETVPRGARLDGPDGMLSGWRWRPLAEAPGMTRCAGIDGFDAALAETSLARACTSGADCVLGVEEERDVNGRTGFRLALPPLRAPFAERYALATETPAGDTVERRVTLCGIAVNEAPSAGDDRATVALGTTLVVGADDPGSLLANDSDDDDVRNGALAIEPVPTRRPRHAALFELADDGGFVYRPREDVELGADGRLEDSFTYVLSDGLHRVGAEVTIAIVAPELVVPNVAPRVTSAPPDIELVVGEALRVDLARHFDDPDGDVLDFSVAPGSLPPSGNLVLAADGLLAGRAATSDLGRWRVTLRVDDGETTIARDFDLAIVRAFAANAPPRALDIDNRVVSGRFAYDVAPFFHDPDGDRLRFDARGLPPSVGIDEDGLIEGRAKRANRGSWFVVVIAEDGRGGHAEDGFRLTIVDDEDDEDDD